MDDREYLDNERNQISYRKGDIIFKEHSFPSGLFCLSKGKVMITKSDEFGNRIVSDLHKEVCFLGTTDYLTGQAYKSTCTALSDCRICLIKSEAIEHFIANNSAFTRKLLNSISQQYHQASARLLALTKKNMNARVADALLLVQDVFGIDTEGYIDVILKRSEIAQICNMSETNAIRHLSALKRSSIISFDGKRIRVENTELLKKESLC